MNFLSRETRIAIIRWLAIFSFVYLTAITLLVIGESSMVFIPLSGPATPQEAGLPHYTQKFITQEGALPIEYWENTAPKNAPTVLYFHGNAGGLYFRNHKATLAYLDAVNIHVIAIEYPGFPGAPGKPSELLMVDQAVTLFDSVNQSGRPSAIWGYSLGTGIAVQLAAKRAPAALVLEAPFTAVVDRANELFPYAPVYRLMKNQFRSRDYIGDVHAPLLILHGMDDGIIPIHHGEELFAMANQPKTFKAYEGVGHMNLIHSNAYGEAVTFLRNHQ